MFIEITFHEYFSNAYWDAGTLPAILGLQTFKMLSAEHVEYCINKQVSISSHKHSLYYMNMGLQCSDTLSKHSIPLKS